MENLVFDYIFTVTGIQVDSERKVAVLNLCGSSFSSKRETSPSEYVDEVHPLVARLELPANMVYAGNKNFRVIKKEYKRLLGNPIKLEGKLISCVDPATLACETSGDPE